jgi:hypothetical protein
MLGLPTRSDHHRKPDAAASDERPASGDGERKAMNTSDTNFEPLPSRAGSASETPETDALAGEWIACECVPASHARKLEKERDEARRNAEVERLSGLAVAAMCQHHKAEIKRLTAAPEGCALPSCSRSLVSESKIEEIIACLWSIMWGILWLNHAPQWLLWAVGLKAASDHLCAVIFAIRGIRSENSQLNQPELG